MFKDVADSSRARVADLRHFGPQAASRPPGPLDKYDARQPVVLCLVPDAGGYEVYAIVEGSGAAPIQLWTQGAAHGFTRPI